MPTHTTIAKLQLDCKTNITQIHQKIELKRSQNQGVKEATFIQIGRRGGDAEIQGDAWRGGKGWKGVERRGKGWKGMERGGKVWKARKGTEM